MIYLKYGKNRLKRTPRRWNPTSGMIKYSTLCGSHRNTLLKKRINKKQAYVPKRTICNNFKKFTNSNSNISNSNNSNSFSNISHSNISNISNLKFSIIPNSNNSYSNISHSNISNLNQN